METKVIHSERLEGEFLYVFDHRQDEDGVKTTVKRRLFTNGKEDPGYPEESIVGTKALMDMPYGALSEYYKIRSGQYT